MNQTTDIRIKFSLVKARSIWFTNLSNQLWTLFYIRYHSNWMKCFFKFSSAKVMVVLFEHQVTSSITGKWGNYSTIQLLFISYHAIILLYVRILLIYVKFYLKYFLKNVQKYINMCQILYNKNNNRTITRIFWISAPNPILTTLYLIRPCAKIVTPIMSKVDSFWG